MNIVIIGATSGIGHKLWQYYSSQGNKVAVLGRRKSEIDSMLRNAPQKTIGISCDIADTVAFNDAFNWIQKELGKIDLIILCAGIGELNPELHIDTELHTILVNVYGWTNCVDRAYNLFLNQQFGHFVALTSVGGLQPTPVAPSYSASKAFQINYIKSLQQKSKRTSIIVSEIRPGLVNTRMAKGEGLFWVMPLDKVVKKIVKDISRKKKRVIVTGRWRFINWLLKHFA